MDEVFWCVKVKKDLKPNGEWWWWQHTFRRTQTASKVAIRTTDCESNPWARYERLERDGLARCVKVRIQEVEE